MKMHRAFYSSDKYKKIKNVTYKNGSVFPKKESSLLAPGGNDLVSCFFILSCAAVTSAQRKGKGSRFDSGILSNFLPLFFRPF